MSTVGEPQDAVPDDGTMHRCTEPEDAPPVPQDAVPDEPGTVRLGRAPGPDQATQAVPTVRLPADPRVQPTVRQPVDPDTVPTVRLPDGPQGVIPTPTVQVPVVPQAVAPTPTLQVQVTPQAAPAPVPAPTLQMTLGQTLAEVPPPTPAPAPVPAAEKSASVPEPGLIRFGPGVPDPKTARTIAVWRGEAAPEPQAEERKRRRGWLFWVPVVLVFLALFGWWLDGLLAPPALTLTGASVQVTPTSLGCDGKATITATVTTDGRAGTFRYRWVRNDGTDSGSLIETVAAGTRRVQLPLIWTLSGPGTFDGKATLVIENHPALTGTATFAYSCAG